MGNTYNRDNEENNMTSLVQYIDLGRIDYRQAYAIQEKIHVACSEKRSKDTIIFQENNPIFTMGRNSAKEHLLLPKEALEEKGIEVEYVDRGGDITYHGPGQLVISFILHLREYNSSIHQYVRNLEEVVISLLQKYDVRGQRIGGASGVWVGEEKVAAIGIAISRGITRHGIAINIKPDLTHYNYIIPCGIRDRGITSLYKLGVDIIDLDQFKESFLIEFNELFNTVTNKIQLNEMRYLDEY
ncbi:MAG: octanoyltransferase [Firmicutes bacterium HGW-Firmicutes-7]|nr:MAG: octanoyltransferase [Firmicutes bacterium HGW-Firmicutes-7]